MVKYNLISDSDHIGLEVIGHASEYHEHHGKNIVCAAISTVCDMAAAGCLFYTSAQIKTDKGYQSIICNKSIETISIITAAMLELKRIEENYPYCFERNETIGSCNNKNV